MKVLLTGSTGFLGSHLLKKLLEHDFEVAIIKRSFSNTFRIKEELGNRNIIVYDIDKTEIEKLFIENNFDIIVHVATEYGRNDNSVYKILETNLVLPIKLIELGIKHKVNGFINTDSYFNKGNATYSNLLNYSLSKRSLLTWLKQLSEQIKVINVVLEHVYGPYDSDTKFVEHFIQEIAVKKVKSVSMTHGHQKRDFIYVDDVTDAYIKLINYIYGHEFKFKTFELGTGKSIEIKELVDNIKYLSCSNTVVGFGEIPYRSDEIMDSKADISQLMELGWLPKISVINGISNILNTYGVINNAK